jgi:hypothetical protein
LPLRISIKRAAELLDIGYEKTWRLVSSGVFTRIDPDGNRGRGKRVYLDPDEVTVYAKAGLNALREYQARKKAKSNKR